MKLTLRKHEEMLLALLRIALRDTKAEAKVEAKAGTDAKTETKAEATTDGKAAKTTAKTAAETVKEAPEATAGRAAEKTAERTTERTGERTAEEKAEAEYRHFQNCCEEEWRKCKELAGEQGVKALAFDGVMRLPGELQPESEFKLQWALSVKKYERIYARYCKMAHELTELFAEHGIATTLLKGVGFSTYYLTPQHRQGGDIDIYTYSADKSKMSDEQANRLADQLIEQQGIEIDNSNYKHSTYFYAGIPIENHKRFVNVREVKIAGKIDQVLTKCRLDEEVALISGKYRIYIPDATFNTQFIGFHTAQHYGAGIALPSLCDGVCPGIG